MGDFVKTINKMIGVCVLAFGLLASNVYAVTVEMDASGLLSGVSGVNLNGKQYDVAFLDGTCNSVYGPCDEQGLNLMFHSYSDAHDANSALISQAFSSNANGTFEYAGNIAGCSPQLSLTGLCELNTPFAAYTKFNYVEAAAGFVYTMGSHGPYIGTTNGFRLTDDLGTMQYANQYVWARWTVTPVPVTPVPEPSILALMCVGLIPLLARLRKV
jgi:hypothetical protein